MNKSTNRFTAVDGGKKRFKSPTVTGQSEKRDKPYTIRSQYRGTMCKN